MWKRHQLCGNKSSVTLSLILFAQSYSLRENAIVVLATPLIQQLFPLFSPIIVSRQAKKRKGFQGWLLCRIAKRWWGNFSDVAQNARGRVCAMAGSKHLLVGVLKLGADSHDFGFLPVLICVYMCCRGRFRYCVGREFRLGLEVGGLLVCAMRIIRTWWGRG